MQKQSVVYTWGVLANQAAQSAVPVHVENLNFDVCSIDIKAGSEVVVLSSNCLKLKSYDKWDMIIN